MNSVLFGWLKGLRLIGTEMERYVAGRTEEGEEQCTYSTKFATAKHRQTQVASNTSMRNEVIAMV